ncbi:malectin domain-containing carbohydrate-binding protein [Robertkochia solimangrovi]|uniref:malectin domain-containing carbohydrate-binding protein n=1 Tax=Robertkochia solimangrovi TaxID=2213046 RepID=UPI00117CCACE|nr:malectin domain-containing carbohydrate-binding protein [Robertkochia solimangrovi]TRZ43495.1 hypothetical protein DMZ48_08695 [Robertkochia solimangrovi]
MGYYYYRNFTRALATRAGLFMALTMIFAVLILKAETNENNDLNGGFTDNPGIGNSSFYIAPCYLLSPLDCSEIAQSLPVNLNFDGAQGGILNTGFTMVDPPSTPLSADVLEADADTPGLIADRLSLSSGYLMVDATRGINYNKPSGSANTNSQMNALGVGFTTSVRVLNVEASLQQPDFSQTSDNRSQQAGIWFGLNEDNYVKLSVIKATATQQKIQLFVEQTNPANPTGALLLDELNTANFNIAGITDIQLRLEVSPLDNTVRGYYILDSGSEVLVGNASLPIPDSFLEGIDHDQDSGTDPLSFAGIMTTLRTDTGGDASSMVISYDSFDVSEMPNDASEMLSFGIPDLGVSGIINGTTVETYVPFGTDITALSPDITVSPFATVDPASGVSTDFTSPVTYTVTAEDGTTTTDYQVSVIAETQPFAAHINFQNNSDDAPAGYLKDYGKEFGFSALNINGTDYNYGWKNSASQLPEDISEEAANNSTGAGRIRIGNYATATIQEKLTGSLIHFQGDNVLNTDGTLQWDGQPRGSEHYWEIEIPNGIYEVTLSLGDKSTSIDSRHSATVEGYTVVPAFAPAIEETRAGTIIVEVTDGVLTMTGHGGYNSKINYIDITESTGTPVSGILSFDPASLNTSLTAGAATILTATLSGAAAESIGLVIDDNINTLDDNAAGSNEWLTLPGATVPGAMDFAITSALLNPADTRSNTVIATQQGYVPAELPIEVTVDAFVSLPFRMNAAGGETTKESDTYIADMTDLLTVPTGVNMQTSTTSYALNGDAANYPDLYYPRRFAPQFSYNIPVPNGDYNVVLHMIDNYFTVAGSRVFDVTVEDVLVADDLDLAGSYGQGTLYAPSYTVNVSDEVLTIAFDASVNNAIINAIEIIPATILSSEKDILAFSIPQQVAEPDFDIDLNTITVSVPNGTDLTALVPEITLSAGATVTPESGIATDFTTPVIYTVTAEDETTKEYTVSVIPEGIPYAAHINFQNNSVDPPTGYSKDYGKEFGNATIAIDGTDYAYGWLDAATLIATDISEEAVNNGNGTGRVRIGNYATATLEEQLTGTLVHFQGDNVLANNGTLSWAGQPRAGEFIWEIEVPNGVYEVTLSLGDKSTSIDSRHSAAVEGYTIIPAFVPEEGETRAETMIVEVTDGRLTVTGQGGYNSKINYIDITESTGTPVSGILAFDPDALNTDLQLGASTTLSSVLSGAAGEVVGLVIDDNINLIDDDAAGRNEWLTLPALLSPGSLDVAITTTALETGSTRNNTVIATQKGYMPASLEVGVTVNSFIGIPFRMNAAGGETTKEGETFVADETQFLSYPGEMLTNNTAYTLQGDAASYPDLYYPRRYADEFSYNFPVPDGAYNVVLHMIENFHTAANARVFDVTIEDVLVEDDLDLFSAYGQGVLAANSYAVTVEDELLTIAFNASIDRGIIMAIEILPATVLSSEKEITAFSIPEQVAEPIVDSDLKMIAIEVPEGTDLTLLVPEITLSAGATISPESGIATDFTNPVVFTVTAEDGSTEDWTVSVTEQVVEICTPISLLDCNDIVTSLPFTLNFDGTEGGLEDQNFAGTGFTMADPHSQPRLTEDGPATYPEVNGYEPSKLFINNNNLEVTATKGIAFTAPPLSSNNNTQINSLGVGLQNINSVLTIETKLLGISTGTGSAQAGIWYGLDEDNFVKLNVTDNTIELRKEEGGITDYDGVTLDQISLNVGAAGNDVSLKLEIDPTAMTITAFYAINDETYIQLTNSTLDNLALPSVYLAGKSITEGIDGVSFAGIYATYRTGSEYVAVFDNFNVSTAPVAPVLAFDASTLNFSGVQGETIASQSVELTANTGDPVVILSDDPDATQWLILPENPTIGTIEFGIQDGLAPGNYSTTVFAIDQPDLGYENAEIQINLVITEEPVDPIAISMNFSDPASAAPTGYIKDGGDPYGDRGNGYFYGWLDEASSAPADLTLNGRNRDVATYSLFNNTMIHMQYGDVSTNASNGYLNHAKWEIEIPNGSYVVTVTVGDANVDGSADDYPTHVINAEGLNIIEGFEPGAGSVRFETASRLIAVNDGKLTIDANGGFNTKIVGVEITSSTGESQTPLVLGVNPADGAIGVSVNTSVSANELFMPNFDTNGVAGIDNSTITTTTVKLTKQGSSTPVPATVNGTGGGDAINLVPTLPLEAEQTYVFTIDGVTDLTGVAFETFTSTFTTGSNTTGPVTDLDNVSFNKAGNVADGSYTSLVIGPDNKLYGLEIDGDIHRWTMESDGTLSGEEILNDWMDNTEYNSSRTAVGLVFDPTATADNLVAYITHMSAGLSSAPDWDGNISRISGPNLATEEHLIMNLPRSLRDHLTNSLTFRPGEPDVIYFNQGSLSAGGQPDGAWGNREESLLSAATLRLDLNLLATYSLPLDVETTRDIDAIKNYDSNSATLDGMYNPYYINAPLTLFATGVRNAYDLVWHTNGQLYVPANGTAGGSNSPASIDGMPRPDGTIYDHSDSDYPVIPAVFNNNVQRDWLFRMDPSTTIGYYGHPNPFRGEFVLNRGDTDVNNYSGISPDINYRGAAFDFEFNKSPNGVIEYRSNAENGNLQGAILVVRYSGGSDIIALVPDGPNGDIATMKVGIPGFTGFSDPLDLIEDVNTGNIYVSDFATNKIVLLRPSNLASPEPVLTVAVEEIVGDAIANNQTYSEELIISNTGNAALSGLDLAITGTDASMFSFNTSATTIGQQSSVSATISFTPTSTGPKFATLTISGDSGDPLNIPLRGLGKTGTGGSNEPSLQYILDTQLGAGVIDVADANPATNQIDPGTGLDYNDILGDELDIQSFERATDAPVSVEVLSVYGPTDNDPIVGFGWYLTGNATATNEIFTVDNDPVRNGQTLNPEITGILQFDPGVAEFGFYNRWPYFNDRHLFSEDALNTFSGAIPHHIRVYALPGENNAYIIATEEHISGFDYQDVVVIVRNIKPAGTSSELACSPISLLDCDQIMVGMPFQLDFTGAEGGLANTGFTMVDNPSARLETDGPITYAEVPGFEPGRLSFSGGNLIINAANGIAYANNTATTLTNSQINTLGVGIDADAYGSFSISTTIVNPYSDATNNSEQAGIWFGLNEDNFVKLVAANNAQVEIRKEEGGVSGSTATDAVAATGLTTLSTSTVKLRLFIDLENDLLTGYYSLNGGEEVLVGSVPLPVSYINGNSSYDDQSFAGIFTSKRREATADINYTFEDFAITPENPVSDFQAVNINFSLPDDIPPTGYTTDSGDAFGDRGNGYVYGWLNASGVTPIDLSANARNRDVPGVDILQNTLMHMQFNNVGGNNGVAQEGIWEIVVPNGNYEVFVGVGDPALDGQENTTPSHTINAEGVNLVDGYVPSGLEGEATRFTSGSGTVVVTDGRLTIDAFGGFNTKINSLRITPVGGVISPYFTNVTPADFATNVSLTDFQINVEIVVPSGYELDKATLAGQINLYEVSGSDEILIPSNSNDTGGGDAITLTPLEDLKENTSYIFRLTDQIEANLIGDLNDRIAFLPFESRFTTGDRDDEVVPIRDLTGVEFVKVPGGTDLGEGTIDQRFSSLAIGPDGKLYGSTIGDFSSDGKIYRWNIDPLDGTLTDLEILSPELQGSPAPNGTARSNNDRMIIGLVFDPAATADNLIAYVTHSMASVTAGPEWDGKITRLSGPDLSTVQDVVVHLPRSLKDHLTNSMVFDDEGVMYIAQGSNTAGGDPDDAWGMRPERLLAGAVLRLDFSKLPPTLPLDAYTTDDISVINAASELSLTMSDGTYNPYATNAPLTIFATGIRNAYDLLWHSNNWLYVPTNGTAGNNSSSPNSPATADYPLARRLDGLTSIPSAPALRGGETQKDWLFKTKGGTYHGHPNPYRGEFVLNHGGISYSGLPGQTETSYVDVQKYPDDLQPDPNYLEPAFDFGKNKSPNGVIEYKSDAFGGKLQGLIMVVRFSGQDDLLVMDPKTNGDIAESYSSIPGLSGFDDPLDVIEDPRTGNLYISEYDRDDNGIARLTLLRATIPATLGPEIAANPEELIFEMTTNGEGSTTDTQTVEITNNGNEVLNISGLAITGTFAAQFESVSGTYSIPVGGTQAIGITYAPELANTNLGYQSAALEISSDDPENPLYSVGLYALKKAGFEGGEEPDLQDVVNTLGIGIDVGWNGLTSDQGTNPVMEGDEVPASLFVKAGPGEITITPVARYSPAEVLPFGWYTNDISIITNEVGILEGTLPEAQTLYPNVISGTTSFDPEGAVFGVYVDSQSFGRTNFTEDDLNTGGVAHRVRTYPVKDREGNIVQNSYLICFEDATNGDYQDYVFVISNAMPYEDGSLVLNFNKNTLNYNAFLNQEELPVQSMTLTANGGVTAADIELSASESWLVVPETITLGTPMDFSIDIDGLAPGNYQATIFATALNYQDAVANVQLTLTEELVFTYQFNFNDPSAPEISPAGYIDDFGVPYSLQSTPDGDLQYGWVLPGTMEPADASANARNRDSGTDDPVLKTFTIIGHGTTAQYPTRDWLVNVPNGTYYVNISVGDPDYNDSNHILEVNGTTVLSFDQENNNPDNLTYFSNTEIVEVTDGILRLSLGNGGANAKPNFIRLAPLNTALLPPTISAVFDGTLNSENVYRGSVAIALGATDNSESGITRLEYILDEGTATAYSEPISVIEAGDHELLVMAEDGNGNYAEKRYPFTIEEPTGALIALENMTKVPGTDRGFPADDYYTFYRIESPGAAVVHDANVMRLHNTGTGELVISAINFSTAGKFTATVPGTGEVLTFPIAIAPGEFTDINLTFVYSSSSGVNSIHVENIDIISNADNSADALATLHGGHTPFPEGGQEINAQEVFNAFGFQTSMISRINDDGGIGNLTTNPSSNFPDPANIDAGYEGDMIEPGTFVQADPTQPVRGIQLSALHGGPSENGASFRSVNGTGIVGDINFSHLGTWYQTLLPRSSSNENLINNDVANSISSPFRIAVAGYLSTGGNNLSGNLEDEILGIRVYRVIDHNGNVVPNEYIVLQDFIQNGCGAGSANCDWNDNTFYFINIRPEAVPTATQIPDYVADIDEFFQYSTVEYFDKGYAGNKLTFSATADGGALPEWLSVNPQTGQLEGTPPSDASAIYEIEVTATDYNLVTASSTFNITVNQPPVAVDDEVNVLLNTPTLLSELLVNDSDPNNDELLIIGVTPASNGLAVVNEGGKTVTYTPLGSFIGTDSFDYTIEDTSGLTSTATVQVTVTGQDNAPIAIASMDVETGNAPLQVQFTGSNSSDDFSEVSYLWDFGDGSTATEADPVHTFTEPGNYTITLQVSDGSKTANTTLALQVQPELVESFALRINTGGATDVIYNGDNFVADNSFTGGSTYTNVNAQVPQLYQTERSSASQTFAYNIPLANGEYTVRLHFAEIYFGATGGSSAPASAGQRIFDVNMEGTLILDNFDINATYGSETPVVLPFDVTVTDGVLNLNLSALAAVGGVNQPKLSAIEVLQFTPAVDVEAIASANLNEGDAPLTVEFDGSESTGFGALEYAWDFGDGTTSDEMSPVHIFTDAGNYEVTLTVTDAQDNSDVSETISITVLVPNAAPVAIALADVTSGPAPLNVNFTGDTSTDDELVTEYLWDFGDGSTSAEANPTHEFATPGIYEVVLTVTDAEDESNSAEAITITVNEPTSGLYSLLINAGGSGMSYDGKIFEADQNFAGGKVYTNTSATVPALYQTERSASPPEFGYNFDVPNGTYQVILHFAEIYHGATGGGTGGTGKRIFDVSIEGDLKLDNYDINAQVGPQTITTETFEVIVEDGQLNLFFSALPAVGGVDQPKVSALEIYELEVVNEAPEAVASVIGQTTGDAPFEVEFSSAGSSDDVAITGYLWDFGDGSTSSEANPTHIYETPGTYEVTLTVNDEEPLNDTTEAITIIVNEPVVICEIPEPWLNNDIGAVAAAGSACFDGGVFTVEASGADIWGTQDEFHFVYQTLEGNGEIIAQVLSLDQTDPWAKGGVMIRNTLAANSAWAMMMTAPTANLAGGGPAYSFQSRSTTGGTSVNTPATAVPGGYPYFVRLVREGNTITGYVSETEGNWTLVGSQTIAMNETAYVGLSTTSHNDGVITTATYANVSVNTINAAPVAVASSDITNGDAPLTVNFTGDTSTDDVLVTEYLWDFGDGSTSTEANPTHQFTTAGIYDVVLTVTDAAGASDSAEAIAITVNETVSDLYSLLINAGGTGMSFDGKFFEADQNFAGGKVYANTSATVPALYQTERSASPPEFGYNFDVPNGTYQVILHFAEIYHGATGGGTGGTGKRIFDVSIEGDLKLDNYDINAEVGPQTVTTETFTVTVIDGQLNLFFSALPAVGGVDQPKVSALEIYELEVVNEAPEAVASVIGQTTGDAPFEVSFSSAGSSDDVAITGYLWDFGDGSTSTEANPTHTYVTPGTYQATLTVNDVEPLSDTSQSITITVNEPVVLCALPTPWLNGDIGAVGATGSTCYDSGVFTVEASGADIWNSADEFHYVYQSLEGDGEIIAQVMSLESTNSWAKAGVMFRNTLAANSAWAMMTTAPNAGLAGGVSAYTFQSRTTAGATPGFTAPAALPGGFPHYVRLVREGNTFTGYVSETNGNWTLVGSQTIAMNETVYVGLATTSHNDGVLTTAVYDNVSVEAYETDPAVNIAPDAVAATIGEQGGEAPFNVTFNSTGSTDDKGIVSYDWQFGDGASSTEANPSHTFTTAGSYLVTLTVTDQEGLDDQDFLIISVIESEEDAVAIESITLINATSDVDLFNLVNGVNINMNDIGNVGLNLRANPASGSVGSVKFVLSGALNYTRMESVQPYALFGDSNGDYYGINLPNGNYTITATPYSGSGGSGIVGEPMTFSFSISSDGSLRSEIDPIKQLNGLTETESIDIAGFEENLIDIQDHGEVAVSMYPNPASDWVNLNVTGISDTLESFRIFDLNGKVIRTYEADKTSQGNNKYALEVSGIAQGTYILSIGTSNGVIKTKMLVIYAQ